MPSLLMVTTIAPTLRGFFLPYAAHYRARGFRVDALASGVSTSPECVQAFERVWEIEWSRNPLAPSNLLKAPARIREVVTREGYDLVHVHTPVAAFVTRYALRRLRRTGKPRVLYTAHGFHFHPEGTRLKNGIFLALEKLAGRWTDYLVVHTQADETAARRWHLVPPERLCPMPGVGVDTRYYDPATVPEAEVSRVRQELGLGPSDRLFIMAAEFIPRKRHRDALAALAHLKRPEAHLALAGNGPLLEPMRRLAADLGIADRVHFVGYRRDIPALIRASAAWVLPSQQEGLQRGIMEALSLEVPAIASRIRGMADLLDPEVGLLFTLGDVPQLAAAMGWILDHPEEARAMGVRGRRRMAAYDIQRLLKMHDVLYDEALRHESAVCDTFEQSVQGNDK